MDILTSAEDLRDAYGQPLPRAVSKLLHRLDAHARHFISLSPFVVLASIDKAGNADSTPRGDAPGFVKILNDHTIVLPDRPGNNRLDTMMNVLEIPRIGMLFIVPGLNETLRVNGGASIVNDTAILNSMSIKERAPKSGLLVSVEEVFFHCGKAMLRSELWNPERQVSRERFPTLGRILADQIAGTDAEAMEAKIENGYQHHLY
jgi:PPOX class probable FMN-dependent enzyme